MYIFYHNSGFIGPHLQFKSQCIPSAWELYAAWTAELVMRVCLCFVESVWDCEALPGAGSKG